jgi:adenosylcobinamide-phosphate synthase
MSITLSLLLGVLLDRLFGELPRWHPLVGFGHCANRLEAWCNQGRLRFVRGTLAWALLVLPLPALLFWLLPAQHLWIANGLALYFAVGSRALVEHGMRVEEALDAGDLAAARQRVGYLVSRETASMDAAAVSRATIESLLENGNDAIFGALFWCAVAGAPGVILFRLANTLDAMWGYRNARFELFGKFAARIDDVLNYLPARLTALSYALLGSTRNALLSWRTQAPHWSSPNAGPVMASGAGSLNLCLGGAAIYEGQVETRITLGAGAPAGPGDIRRASTLISRSMLLWLACAGILEALYGAV